MIRSTRGHTSLVALFDEHWEMYASTKCGCGQEQPQGRSKHLEFVVLEFLLFLPDEEREALGPPVPRSCRVCRES